MQRRKGFCRVYTPSLILIILVLALTGWGQTSCGVPGNYCMSNTTVNTCSGYVFDAGGGDSYPDTPYTMTICPDAPGDVIQLYFVAFSLQTSPNSNNSDYLTFYDGPDTGSPSLGSYTGTSLQGISVTATINNPSGCLTLRFLPQGMPNDVFPGFSAQISCTTPCAPPVASSAFQNPVPGPGDEGIRVCVGAPITFQDNDSFAQPGFSLAQYTWQFGNGESASTTSTSITYSYEEPGEFLVSLIVEDNNGCSSLNISPLRVLVSTIPEFPEISLNQTQYCFGQTVSLGIGQVISPTWTALPPQVVSGETFLQDGAGFTYASSLVFDFFEDGAVVTNCCGSEPNDLINLFVNMEHSYLGDLGITITCPNGTTVSLLTWPNGGGGTFLGEAVDDESQTPGIGYDYFWDPCATNGTMGQNSTGVSILPSGTYQASENMCNLVGCPLNGQWTFEVTDNLAFDNGFIFAWGLNFNSSLIPGLTTFTPTIGAGADSSYWSGPFITSASPDMNNITITLPAPGSYDYTYTAINSFGCSVDTTITVTVDPPPTISAGPDLVFGCQPLTLNGGFENLPTPACGSASGTYTHCYGDNQNYSVTYCPDNPGDGFSSIQIDFIAGEVETFFDEFYVFDGNSTIAPLLAGYNWPIYGNLGGYSFTATNPSGCLTIQVTPDGSISCQSGNFLPWFYTVGCSSPMNYEWSWTPSTGLTDPSSPVTTLNTLSQPTTFTLTGHPAGIPECATSDQTTVTIASEMSVDVDPLYQGCHGDEITILAPQISGGTAPFVIQWVNENGQVMNGPSFSTTVTANEVFCVTVTDQCNAQGEGCTLVNPLPQVPATFTANPPFGCDPLTSVMLSDYTYYNELLSMSWDFGNGDSATTMGSASYTYTEPGLYFPTLTLVTIEGCEYSYIAENAVQVWPTPTASFTANPPVAILPNSTFSFQNNTINATTYEWDFNGLGSAVTTNAGFTFSSVTNGIYYVQLNAYSSFGCKDSTVRLVIVRDDIDIYIPNCFTPDGDGINDSWFVMGKGFVEEGFLLQVFDRWGDLVYESTDPYEAWTGNYRKGEIFVPDGVYLYRCRARDVQNDVNHDYEGHVLIIR